MKQIYVYKEFVDKSGIKFIGDIESNRRYLLEIPFKSKIDKEVLVIMKNPSKANDKVSDLTIDRVLTFCHNEGYGKVYTMNLFSYYSTKPNRITELIDAGKYLEAVGEKNDQILKEVSDVVDEIIVAWGGNSINRKHYYIRRINEVVDIIRDKKIFYVQSVSGDGYYPRHPQVWSVKQAIKKYIWTPPC